jgi:hypothetical protein
VNAWTIPAAIKTMARMVQEINIIFLFTSPVLVEFPL